jgi:hypothetical protein
MILRRWILLAILSIGIELLIGLYFIYWGKAQASVLAWFRRKGMKEITHERALTLRRIILLGLAVIAIGLMVAVSILHPLNKVAFLCTLYTILVFFLNLREYLKPAPGDMGALTRRRKILLALLAEAVLIGVVYAYWPDVWLEYAFYIFGLPVILANAWEWFDPEIMEKLVGKKGEDT